VISCTPTANDGEYAFSAGIIRQNRPVCGWTASFNRAKIEHYARDVERHFSKLFDLQVLFYNLFFHAISVKLIYTIQK
jgi:hypothetical protein